MSLFGSKKKEEKKDVVAKDVSKASVKSAPVKAAGKSVQSAQKAPAKKAKTEVSVSTKAPATNKTPAVKNSKPTIVPTSGRNVIIRPRITEKATMKADTENVYVFEIAHDATKRLVREAVMTMYGVTPFKVSVARTPSKKVFSRGKRGVTSEIKKAYVYLNKTDKIEIV